MKTLLSLSLFMFPSLSLPLPFSLSLSLYLSLPPSACLSLCLSLPPSACLSLYLSLPPSACLSLYLSLLRLYECNSKSTTLIDSYRFISILFFEATGKSETIREMSAIVGKFFFPLTCSSTMSYKSLIDIFKGLTGSGSYCCFNDFHYLLPDVMSVCAVHFKIISDALRVYDSQLLPLPLINIGKLV